MVKTYSKFSCRKKNLLPGVKKRKNQNPMKTRVERPASLGILEALERALTFMHLQLTDGRRSIRVLCLCCEALLYLGIMHTSVLKAAASVAVLAATGAVTYTFVCEQQALTQGSLRKSAESQRSPARDQGRDRMQAIGKLVDDLKDKTVAEKLEQVFDGAVKTHEIGFPDEKR